MNYSRYSAGISQPIFLCKYAIMKSFYEYFTGEVSEANYPSSFSIDIFKKLPSFRQRVDYANKTLKRISSGSSRIVYEVDEKTVLKIAKNQKGIAQNELEIEMSDDYYLNGIGLMAEIYEKDEENFLWLEMEKAEKLTERKFKQLTGQSFETLSRFIFYFFKQYYRRPMYFRAMSDEEAEKLVSPDELFPETNYGTEFFEKVEDYVSNYQPDVSTVQDMTQMSTWGIVKRNGKEEVVIVDYGVNEDIINKYYKKHRG